MEALDTTGVETSIAVEDDNTALWMGKKRRRVSFAHTDTVHVFPRDDVQTPPLVLNAGLLSIEHNNSLPLEPSIAAGPASESAILRPSAADPNLFSGARLHENSADFSHFSCDMDISNRSWDDKECTTSPDSLNGVEDDSGCFVRVGHLSSVEDEDSIVDDVMDYDNTMDATTFSINVSHLLKSNRTITARHETGRLGQVLCANDSDSRSLDDSMALTRLGAPHWALVNPQDVFTQADEEQSDMSLLTGDMGQVASHKKANNPHSEIKKDELAFPKPAAPHCALVCPQDASVHADDSENDMSIPTETLLKTAVPKHTTEVSRDSNGSVAAIVVDQPSNQFKGANRESLDMKPVLMEVKKPNEGQQLTESSLFSSVEEPRSLSEGQQLYTAMGRPVLMEVTKPNEGQQVTESSLCPSVKEPRSLSKAQQLFTAMNRPILMEVKKPNEGQQLTDSSLRPNVKEPRSISKVQQLYMADRSVLMEVKKQNEGQQLTESSCCPNVKEPRSLIKVQQPYTAMGRPVLADSTNIQHMPEGNLQEDKKLCKPSPQKIRMSMNSKVVAGVVNSGGIGKEPHTKGSLFLKDLLQHLKGETFHGEDQGEEENMVPLLLSKLQTLGDYLQFSCSVQPLMGWLREHVQELETKLQAAKKRNAELRSFNSYVQKLPENSTHIFKSKFASKHSLAKRGWLLWKMKPERQILALLQESKDNLLNEVEAVQGQGQQVLHLKESYSIVALKVESSLHSSQSAAISAATSKEAQLSTHLKSREMDSTLENYNHHYEDACERLRILKAKSNKIHTQIESIASAYGHKLQSAADGPVVSFEKKLEALIQKLLLTINLLEQQQVMESNLKSSGGKSVVDFCLEGMYSQSFQFEENSPHVKLLTSLHPEAINMMFPCMDASLLFQYIISDLHSNALIPMQRVHGIIQRTNYLFGCLMDVLKEIRYCRRSFWISCKFKMQHDKLLLYVMFLRCASGLKVVLAFDMVCLKKGMYPSDLKPAHIQIVSYGRTSADEPITRKEVQARITKIQPGFARLHRICCCVDGLMKTAEPIV